MFEIGSIGGYLLTELTRPWSLLFYLFSGSKPYKIFESFKNSVQSDNTIFVVGIVILYFILYFLEALALKKLADRLNLSYSWLAFVPFLNCCLYGPIIFNKDDDKVKSNLCTALLLWFSVFMSFLGLDSIGPWSIIVYDIPVSFVEAFYSYKIYSMLSKKAKGMLIFDVLTFGKFSPFMLFSVRNNKFLKDKD